MRILYGRVRVLYGRIRVFTLWEGWGTPWEGKGTLFAGRCTLWERKVIPSVAKCNLYTRYMYLKVKELHLRVCALCGGEMVLYGRIRVHVVRALYLRVYVLGYSVEGCSIGD